MSILDNSSRLNELKSRNGLRISSKKGVSSYLQDRQFKREVLENLERYKTDLPEEIYNFHKETLGVGNSYPKEEEESWTVYFKRILPANLSLKMLEKLCR